MGRLLDRLGVERPVVQAGMGGGISRHELATAVSDAGGLGTLGLLDPPALRRELVAARERTAAPIAVNLLLPFARAGHWEVARDADAVVTYWGRPQRRTDGVWLHGVGSVAEACEARAAGVDGVIVQGVEAGGHVRGRLAAHELLARARAALPDDLPLLLAGGIADRDDVRRALDAGAEAAVLGTRFLLSEESRAHPDYRGRLLDAGRTVLTELFGLGWPAAPHRVVPNAATRRWADGEGRVGWGVRAAHRLSAPAVRALPAGPQARLTALQRPAVPLLSPYAPTDDRPAALVDAGPLYAGESVLRMEAVRPAGALVAELTPA